MPIVHGVNASPFVRKVRVVLAEKGIEYELNPVMPLGDNPEYRRKSPLGKIPCFEDGDYVLPDSSCIAAYLERTQPEPALYPADAKEHGRALWYEEYADTKLAEVCGTVFFQRVVSAKILKTGCDEAAVENAVKELQPPVFDYLEGEVEEGGEGIVGGRFGIADISLASPVVNLQHAGFDIDAARWPKLSAYVERVLARPSYKTIVEEERASFSAL